MELYQLEYVLAVAKYQNFTQAATEVCVTPSSLSQQIKKLENELGVSLFKRTTRSVHLTPAGIEFVKEAKKIMSSISEINEAMQKYAAGTCGQLSIGGTPALKVFGITHIIGLFQKEYSEITLNFHEAECFDLIPLLCSGKIDVAFLTAFNHYKQDKQEKMPLESYPLVNDEVVLVTSISHPLASREVVNLRDLSQERFIFFPKSSGLYEDTIRACHQVGFEPIPAYFTKYVDTCLGLVSEGLGIALLSSRTVINTLWKNIAIIRIEPKIRRTLYLVFPKEEDMPPVLLNFINYIKFHEHLGNDPSNVALSRN